MLLLSQGMVTGLRLTISKIYIDFFHPPPMASAHVLASFLFLNVFQIRYSIFLSFYAIIEKAHRYMRTFYS